MDILYGRSPVDRPRVRVKRDNQQRFCDGLGRQRPTSRFVRWQKITAERAQNTQTLSQNDQKRTFFVTTDSWRYQLDSEAYMRSSRKKRVDARYSMDSVSARFVRVQTPMDYAERYAWHKLSQLRTRLFGFRFMHTWHFSPLRLWQFSMIGAMLFGMIAMSAIYKNLGRSVYASSLNTQRAMNFDPVTALLIDGGTEAINEEDIAPVTTHDVGELPLVGARQKDPEQVAFEERARKLVAGYPIEKMLPYIFKQDREVAMYLIAIAKQESAWGKRVPVLNGEDCYNYWGYRAKRARMGSGGHTCFDSREDAVATVGKRLHSLFYEYERKTPRSMLVWKCGRSCASHDPAGVERWVRTVTQYRNALKSSR